MLNTKRLRTKFKQYNDQNELYCYKCLNYKPITDFDTNSDKSNWFREFKDKRCKNCKKLQYEKRRIKNRGDHGIERLLTERYCALRDRAKNKGLIVDFDRSYLKELWKIQKGKCAISGLPMTTLVFSGRVSTNISVDRKDSSKGYIKDNIQLVCMAVNQMKSNLTTEELLFFCKNIIQNYENTH